MEQKFIFLKETAEKWGIGDGRINTLCLQGRILGVFKVGNTWAIPENAEKPNDMRIKTGKYVKRSNKDVWKIYIQISVGGNYWWQEMK